MPTRTIRLAAVPLATLALLAGCSGGGSGSSTGGGGGTQTGGATYVYVGQYNTSTPGTILAFTAGANGAVSPVSTLQTDLYLESLATDASGQIYVSGYSATSSFARIEVYAAGASGSATPTRSLTLSSVNAPISMTVDASSNLYTVDSAGLINVYSPTASGSATPTRQISGSSTAIGTLSGIAVDSSGAIYVSEVSPTGGSTVLTFAAGASGNIAPTRSFTLPGTSVVPLGIALDSSNNIYVTVDGTSTPYTSSIYEYAAGAGTGAAPTRTISGSATEMTTDGALRVDSAGNIYVAVQNPSGAGYAYSLMEFSSSASGNVSPKAAMTSTAWTNGISQIAIH